MRLEIFRRLTRFGRRLRDERGGTIAIKFALIAPAVLMLGAGAVDLHSVYAATTRLQDIADAAALAGGKELSLAVQVNGPIVRAEAFVQMHLADWPDKPMVKTDVAVIALERQRALRVTLTGTRTSFFGNLLPPGGWKLRAEAIASPVAIAPLCVLTIGGTQADALFLRQRAAIEAPACLLHSNQKARAADQSRIQAATTQASKSATGSIQAAPQTGARPLADPYLSLNPAAPSTCGARRIVEIKTSQILSPGIHCNDIVVSGRAVLTLAAGEHYFVGGRLLLRENARLAGQDVVMIFDHAAFDFLGQSRVSLAGRRSGRYAGFVLIGLRPPEGFCPHGRPADDDDDDDDGDDDDEDDDGHHHHHGHHGMSQVQLEALLDRQRPNDCSLGSEFKMATDNVEVLDGVIYFPVSKLIVEGTGDVAEASEWTVMIVDALEVRGSPRLIINADYSGSLVPVPSGVGPRAGAVNLVR